LDAPTVAALWTWFIGSANHIHLPLSSTLSMALAVWMLYAGDRLLDARVLDVDPARYEGLEARHYFHHRHRTGFLTGIFLCCVGLAALLPRLDVAAVRLYLILGGLVAGYFLVIHATSSVAAQQKVARRMPKEIVVGLCFGAATFIPTVARRPELRLPLLPIGLLFAALCSLNCLFIYAWEHEGDRASRGIPAMSRVALGKLPALSAALIFCSIVLVLLDHRVPWPVSCAGALSAAFLLLLHDRRRGIARTTLRAAADLALITPVLFFPFVLR
jgi:4-hydroxybenzoate polyprenyltransferase